MDYVSSKQMELIECQETELSTTSSSIAKWVVNSTTHDTGLNEDFAEAVEDAKPISTGRVGSGHVREYRAKIRYLRKRRAALQRTVLQKTWIYKLG